MIKTRIICCILFFTIPFAAFSLELTTGLTYDTHEGSLPVGTDFSLKETFSDSSNLTAGLRYNNAGAYTATFTYCRFLNIYLPFMNIQLKGTADIINPEYTGSQTPYTISLSTGFTL